MKQQFFKTANYDNKILGNGEIGKDLNTGIVKVGDGVSKWEDLKPVENVYVIGIDDNAGWIYKSKSDIVSDITFNIIQIFEDTLAEHNIFIPDENREGDKDEACIYGKTYYDIEEKIKNIINNCLEVGETCLK